jgi:hypothetical protein
MSTEHGAPAGWYQIDSQVERWWDGSQWGEQYRPIARPRSVTPAPPRKSVTYSPARTSHTFHLLMTLLTCGLWAVFVWLPISIINSLRRDKSVTHFR